MSSTSALAGVKAPSAAIPALDGIRALAVMLVFFSHGGPGTMVPGGLGVTVFFVLSGYLITTLLRREYAAGGSIAMPAFYLRRLLRLMPPLLVVVLFAGLLSEAGVIEGGFTWSGLLSVLFYFGNYHAVLTDFSGIPSGLGVVWSLAVEEHYYLLYPPLLLLLLHRGGRWLPIATLATLCLVILVWRVWLFQQGVSAAHLTMATDTRADAILIGCIMAFLRNPDAVTRPEGTPWLARDIAIAGFCVLLLIGTLLFRDEGFRMTLRYTLQCLAIAPLMHLAVVYASSPAARWLGSRVMRYVGTVSYTIYLSHQIVLYGVMHNAPALGVVSTLLITVLITVVIAEMMRRWVEVPTAGLRKMLHAKGSVSKVQADPAQASAR